MNELSEEIDRLRTLVDRLTGLFDSRYPTELKTGKVDFSWTGDWSVVPTTFDAAWMAAIQGVSRRTVWVRCQKRTQHPRPMSWTRPYRWLKSTASPLSRPAHPFGRSGSCVRGQGPHFRRDQTRPFGAHVRDY
jgi:hypothetical protein